MTNKPHKKKFLKRSPARGRFQNSTRGLYPLLPSAETFSDIRATLLAGHQSVVRRQHGERDVKVDAAAFVSRYFPRTIKIPARLRDRSLEALFGSRKISARLTHMLQRWGARVLGDLHGRRVGDFAWQRNCGLKTLQELDSLASVLSDQASSTGLGANRTAFAVPRSVCRLRFDELPITKRLANVVSSNGLRTLGDLRGRTRFELLQYWACGWRTVAEIQQVIERAISGEFDVAQIDESRAPVGLLLLLEHGIERLTPRDRQFLLARLRGMTFAEIGRRHGLTRARAHQAVMKALNVLRKTWGPRIPRLLQTIRAHYFSIPNGSGLTPALLNQWVGHASKSVRLSRKAQVRLIAALDKNIPVSPD